MVDLLVAYLVDAKVVMMAALWAHKLAVQMAVLRAAVLAAEWVLQTVALKVV